jgi:hypothetical protein
MRVSKNAGADKQVDVAAARFEAVVAIPDGFLVGLSSKYLLW